MTRDKLGSEPQGRSGRATALSASLEDYLEAIFWLQRKSGVARVSHIARRLGVNMSSVTGALRHLAEHGYIEYDPYQFIRLNAAGEAKAREIAGRHQILKRFLVEALSVEETLAGDTACKMEHQIDRRVLDRLLEFVRFVSGQCSEGRTWSELFARFREQDQPDPVTLEAEP